MDLCWVFYNTWTGAYLLKYVFAQLRKRQIVDVQEKCILNDKGTQYSTLC